jgi:hypothetical protein
LSIFHFRLFCACLSTNLMFISVSAFLSVYDGKIVNIIYLWLTVACVHHYELCGIRLIAYS